MTTTAQDLTIVERLCQLLDHLGIERAHIAAGVPQDVDGFVSQVPDRITSLTLFCPPRTEADRTGAILSRTLVLHGDSGPAGQMIAQSLKQVTACERLSLQDYPHFAWSDLIADRASEVGDSVIEFAGRMEHLHGSGMVAIPAGSGEVAGLTYEVRGSGVPLVLLPLMLAPSQWDPLLDRLSGHFCTIVVGGAHLGMVRGMEQRAREPAFRAAVRTMVDCLNLQPGERVLDVGCGTGADVRWLARSTNGRNPITAVDINAYFLREAAALARRDGLDTHIDVRPGDAESLPFDDAAFDITFSVTVMEEADAGRMLAEMVRVTKSGGRIGVIVRATDRGGFVNAPLSPDLRAQLEAPGAIDRGGVSPGGCADASLYTRMQRAGLQDLFMLPQLLAWQPGQWLDSFVPGIAAKFSGDQAREWQTAVQQARTDGTFFIAHPFHCAVGTKA